MRQKMSQWMRAGGISLMLLGVMNGAARAAFTFTPGDFYSSNYFSQTISQYSPSGALVGSLTLPASAADEIRGLAFGPDGLLYATAVRGSGLAVLALNSSGTIVQTYSADVYAAGNLSFGKLAVDGQHIYVAAQNDLIKFNVGDPSSESVLFSNNQVFDVNILANKDLLVASAYDVQEITPAGTVVRGIEPAGNMYVDVRGIQYDPSSNKLFVSMLGYSDFFFQLMRINATTGVLEKSTTFNYADDLFLTDSGKLLVGSRTTAPTFYTEGLSTTGTLGGGQQMFVTEFLVPEPTGVSAVAVFASAMLLRRKRRRAAGQI